MQGHTHHAANSAVCEHRHKLPSPSREEEHRRRTGIYPGTSAGPVVRDGQRPEIEEVKGDKMVRRENRRQKVWKKKRDSMHRY